MDPVLEKTLKSLSLNEQRQALEILKESMKGKKESPSTKRGFLFTVLIICLILIGGLWGAWNYSSSIIQPQIGLAKMNPGLVLDVLLVLAILRISFVVLCFLQGLLHEWYLRKFVDLSGIPSEQKQDTTSASKESLHSLASILPGLLVSLIAITIAAHQLFGEYFGYYLILLGWYLLLVICRVLAEAAYIYNDVKARQEYAQDPTISKPTVHSVRCIVWSNMWIIMVDQLFNFTNWVAVICVFLWCNTSAAPFAALAAEAVLNETTQVSKNVCNAAARGLSKILRRRFMT